jgi:hypothetical protein
MVSSTRPSRSSRAISRESVHVLAEAVHAHRAAVRAVQLLQHLEVARAQAVLRLQLAVQRAGDPLIAGHQLVPLPGELVVVTGLRHARTLSHAATKYALEKNACALDAHA